MPIDGRGVGVGWSVHIAPPRPRRGSGFRVCVGMVCAVAVGRRASLFSVVACGRSCKRYVCKCRNGYHLRRTLPRYARQGYCPVLAAAFANGATVPLQRLAAITANCTALTLYPPPCIIQNFAYFV